MNKRVCETTARWRGTCQSPCEKEGEMSTDLALTLAPPKVNLIVQNLLLGALQFISTGYAYHT